MKHWSNVRKLSFIVHVTFVSIPFAAASVSALLFWHDLFGSWYFAVPMVTVIDLLALTGLILFIARIPSPFVPLRHALPFVSIVPLARELYLLLASNGDWVAVPITAIIIGIFTWIAWQCYRTIEHLFVSPAVAARERERERLSQLAVELEQLAEHDSILHEFVSVLTAPHQIASHEMTVIDTPLPQPAITDDSATVTSLSESNNKTARVEALAQQHGVSVSTAWRNVRSGKWSV
jgi:hypothetical protein